MTSTDDINAATTLLDYPTGYTEARTDRTTKALAQALTALAQALTALAQTARTDTQPTAIPAAPAPADVTARILTAYGRHFNDHRATVDIHDYNRGGTGYSQSRCICGDTSPEHEASLRNDSVLFWARDHADECMAMPRPTTPAARPTAA